jgi:hypothetical protein
MKFDNLAPVPKDKLYLIALAAPSAEIVRVPAESLIKREGKVVELERVSSTHGPMKARTYVKRAAGPDQRIKSPPVYRKKFEETT